MAHNNPLLVLDLGYSVDVSVVNINNYCKQHCLQKKGSTINITLIVIL